MKCGAIQSRRIKIGGLGIFLSLVLHFQFSGLFHAVTWTEDDVTAPTFSNLQSASTLVHCVGDNFLEKSSWHFKSCHYRNLCHDEDGQWTIHPSKKQVELEEDTKHLFLSTKLVQNISTIGLRPAWVRTKEHQWSPRLAKFIDMNIASQPVRHVDETVIIISVPPFESMLPFLVDTLFPIFNLIEIFHLSEQKNLGVGKSKQIKVHVLNLGDFDDISWLERGLNWMGYELFIPSARTSSAGTVSSSSRVCFSDAAAGVGMLTISGLSSRTATKLRNQARGSILYQFRNHLVRHISKNFDAPKVTPASGRSIYEIRLALTKDQNDLSKSLEAALVNKRQVHSLQNVDWSSSNAENLMETAQSSNAWIAFANNENCTWPALFLPQGAHLILLYDPKALVKTKRRSTKARPIKLDVGLWNQLSHIHVHWLSLSHPTKTLANLIYDILLGNNDESVNGIYRNNTTDEDDESASGSTSSGSKDITFSGMPVTLKSSSFPTPPSRVHCISENWMWNAAHYRSCHVQHLCFDTDSKSFVLPTSSVASKYDLFPMDSVSTWADPQKTKVMIGHSIRHSTADDVWFPKRVQPLQNSYYALDSKVVWMPFFTEQPNIQNPGHLMWDFWLPMYTLLELFSLQKGGIEGLSPTLLLTNLDSSCTNGTKCYSMVSKFLPFLGVSKESFLSTMESQLSVPTNDAARSSLVCAENALMGIGMLTDHGSKKHGQLAEDYQSVQNIGRGPMIWRFRNFMLKNLQRGKNAQVQNRHKPWRITFSINSSQNPSRRRNLERQIEIAQHLHPPENNKLGIVVTAVQMDQLTLDAQIQLMDETAIFVSVMGGSASTAMFLPKDASLVLYYNDIDDFVEGRIKGERMPNRMDWDFWNNASYLRVHWLPIQGMDSEADLKIFAKLLEHEVATGILASVTKRR